MKEEKCSLVINNMLTGQSQRTNFEEIYRAASIIKLPLLLVILRKASLNQMMNTKVLLLDKDKVPGCGHLKNLPEGSEFSIEELCNYMISISDNTATNLLLDYYGLSWFKQEFLDLGLRDTKLKRKLFDKTQQSLGLENSFSVEEMSFLLEKIFVSSYLAKGDFYDRARDYLLQQKINHKLDPLLYRGSFVAHKTGEDDGITHDVGIVFSKTCYTFVFAAENCDVKVREKQYRDQSLFMVENRI
ncbi:MAG: serine hydrolase [Tissierellia bacterium]|nr:serine hydrolase [Tissierellia bacterium]